MRTCISHEPVVPGAYCRMTASLPGKQHTAIFAPGAKLASGNGFTTFYAHKCGIKPGVTYGESDEFGVNVASDRVHVHDLHATILHLLGFDHTRLSYRFQGLDQRLTGVEPARVVNEILASS